MRPKLKADTFCIPAANGVNIRSGAQWFTLNGKSTYLWLERLTPHLDGRCTLDELTNGLPPDKRTMVRDLVDQLAAHGCIKDVTADRPHGLLPAEEQAYAAEIAFIDQFGDSAAARFEQFRLQRVLLIGAGLTLTALVHATLRCGVRQVHVLTTGECPTNTARHDEYLALFHDRDPHQQLTPVEGADWDDATVRALVADYDAVLHVSDRPMIGRATQLARACASTGTRLVQAVIGKGTAWLGPLTNGEPGCWECGWRRLGVQAPSGAKGWQNVPDAPDEPFLAATTAGIVANYLSFDYFRAVTGAGQPETYQRLMEFDLETLQSRAHRVIPHPACRTCQRPAPLSAADALAQVQQLIAAEDVPTSVCSLQAASLFDPAIGLFRTLDEHDFVQLPLNVAQATLPTLPGLAETDVLGVGLGAGLARRRASWRAGAYYAAATVVPARLIDPTHLPDAPRACWVEGTTAATWAYDTRSGDLVLVPAAAVFPALGTSPAGAAQLATVAAGRSWWAAVGRGVLGWLRAQIIHDLRDQRQWGAIIDLHQAPLSDHATRYRRMLTLIDRPADVYLLPNRFNLPACAAIWCGTCIGYTVHPDITTALEQALELLVQQHQSESAGQPAIAPLPVVDLPHALRGTTAAMLPVADSRSWDAWTPMLLARLADAGWRVYVAPLDHDPALAAAFPVTVRVLVSENAP